MNTFMYVIDRNIAWVSIIDKRTETDIQFENDIEKMHPAQAVHALPILSTLTLMFNQG